MAGAPARGGGDGGFCWEAECCAILTMHVQLGSSSGVLHRRDPGLAPPLPAPQARAAAGQRRARSERRKRRGGGSGGAGGGSQARQGAAAGEGRANRHAGAAARTWADPAWAGRESSLRDVRPLLKRPPSPSPAAQPNANARFANCFLPPERSSPTPLSDPPLHPFPLPQPDAYEFSIRTPVTPVRWKDYDEVGAGKCCRTV